LDSARQIRILFIHHNSAPGGAELSFADLVCSLSSDISKICALPEGPLARKLSSKGVQVVIVPMRPLYRSINPFYWLSSGLNVLSAMFKMTRICRREGIQLIHANTFTGAIYAAPASLMSGIPMMWHERDLARHPLLTPIISKFARKIIAISNAVADNLKSQFGTSGKIQVIYNGINIEGFAEDRKSEMQIHGVPAGKQVVLMTGQFVPWKGHKDFIDMASLVAENIPNAVFVLSGDRNKPGQQEYVRELEGLIEEKKLKDKFFWTGFTEDMPGLLKSIDCVVLPSAGEPFGRIVIESMAAGKPVVGVRAGAVPELIENGGTGFLVEPGDARAMAKTVSKLLCEDELSESIGEKGRLRASQKFTVARMTKEFEELAISCLNDFQKGG